MLSQDCKANCVLAASWKFHREQKYNCPFLEHSLSGSRFVVTHGSALLQALMLTETVPRGSGDGTQGTLQLNALVTVDCPHKDGSGYQKEGRKPRLNSM